MNRTDNNLGEATHRDHLIGTRTMSPGPGHQEVTLVKVSHFGSSNFIRAPPVKILLHQQRTEQKLVSNTHTHTDKMVSSIVSMFLTIEYSDKTLITSFVLTA